MAGSSRSVHITETTSDGCPVSLQALLAFEPPRVAEFDNLSHEWRRLGAQVSLEEFVIRVRQPCPPGTDEEGKAP
ncbi:MAG: hypothetical protein WAV54_09695 [Acidimicrobiales bacterium]